MKQMTAICMLTGLFLSSASAAEADEIYRCGNIWSNRPCKGAETAAARLPNITRIERGDMRRGTQPPPIGASTNGVTNAAVQPSAAADGAARGRLVNEPPPGVPVCKESSEGVEVRITDVKLKRLEVPESTRTTMTATVRNSSTRDLLSPVAVTVRDASGNGNVLSRVAAEKLPAGSFADVVMDVKETAVGEPHGGVIDIGVVYSPALTCDRRTVNLASAELSREYVRTFPDSTVNAPAFFAEVRSSLDRLDAEVRKTQRQFSGTLDAEKNERLQAAQVALRTRHNRICSRARGIGSGMRGGGFETADERCRDLERVINGLITG